MSLDVLVLHSGILPPKDTVVLPMNWKARLLPDHFGLFMPLEQTGGRVPVFVGVTALEYQEETGLMLHSEAKEGFVCNPVDSLECLLILPYPVEKVNENDSIKKRYSNF